MPTGFEVKAAEELLDAEFIAKWRDRQAIDPLARAVLRAILERFIEVGDPVTVETVAALLPERDPTQVSEAVARLDDKDLILTQGGTVMVAYPFAATPTTFKVLMPDGGQRYAVCAIDALGVSPMLGRPVTIHSHCHHCGAPLELHVRPNGPVGSGEVMVWVGERGDARQKACTSL